MSNVPNFIRDLTTIQAAGPVNALIKGLVDGVHESSGLMNMLGKFGKKPWDEGGEYIRWTINDNKRRPTPVWGRGKVNTGGQEFGKGMSEIRGSFTLDIAYDEFQLAQNRNNPDKMYSYVAEQINNTKNDFVEGIELGITGSRTTRGDGETYADIATTTPNGDTSHIVVGLETWVEATCDPSAFSSTTVIGGQTRSSTKTWLNNQAFSVANEAAITSSDIMKMVQRCSHLGQSPYLERNQGRIVLRSQFAVSRRTWVPREHHYGETHHGPVQEHDGCFRRWTRHRFHQQEENLFSQHRGRYEPVRRSDVRHEAGRDSSRTRSAAGVCAAYDVAGAAYHE
ncbi:MAG: hypothetical protein JRL30_27625 [Deltaproteobacteria bacterium]|nr:hypothetical protein [Deltaproteobacteria bacterium]